MDESARVGNSAVGAENACGRLVSDESLVARGAKGPVSIEGRAEDAMGLVRWPERPEAESGEDIRVGALYRYRAGRQDASLDVSGRKGV